MIVHKYVINIKSKTCRLTGNSKLLVGVDVSVSGCLSVDPVINCTRPLVQCQLGLAPAPLRPAKDKQS